MNLKLSGALAAGCALLFVPCAARAQMGFTVTERFEATQVSLAKRYGSVALYPIAAFNEGGTFGGGVSGTRTDVGGLGAINLGIQSANGKNSYEIGGWYWSKGSSDLYQIDGRAFFTPNVGVQLGRLASTKVGGEAYTGFLVYDITAKQLAPDIARDAALEVGVGTLDDPTGGKTTNDFSAYAQVSVDVGKRTTLNASQWYLRDRGEDLTRFALGVGYNF